MDDKVVVPVRIGALNRITIPKEIRETLDVQEGEYVLWVSNGLIACVQKLKPTTAP
jgi:AbrB family looped-hinge helix DNA binding protein